MPRQRTASGASVRMTLSAKDNARLLTDHVLPTDGCGKETNQRNGHGALARSNGHGNQNENSV
jgi:hypothetical protein